MAAILHVLEGPDTGRLFALTDDQITIGRNAENTITLNDVAVSGVHSKIVRDEKGQFTIHDVSSTNGTFLNGREQRAADLKHGDRIIIGSTTFAFELRKQSRRIKGGLDDEGMIHAPAQDYAKAGPKIEVADLSREQLEYAYRQGQILNRLDTLLSSKAGASEILSSVLDGAMTAASATRGIVLLVDGKSGEMVPSVVRTRTAGGEDVVFSKTLAYEVAATGKGYVGDSLTAAKDEPVLCAPIKTTSTTDGVLFLSGPTDGSFDRSHLEAVTALTRRAGASLSAAKWQVDFELLFSSMIDAIMNTIQAKDVYTRGHSERVRHYSKLLGKELGMTPEQLYRLTLGAAIHDIGKVGMPDSVLKHNKSPILTPEQMAEVRKHPVRGGKILEDISFLADVIPAVSMHHEDWDGTGYPHGLKGDEVPLIARVVAVADTYDAITTDRPYQKGKSYEEGHAILRKIAGKRLEPELVEHFISAWKKYRKGPVRRILKTTRMEQPIPTISPVYDSSGEEYETARTDRPETVRPDTGDPDIDDKLSQIIEIG